MNKKKKYVIVALSIFILLLGGWFAWHKWASPTRIALYNFQPFQVSGISLSNSDKFIKYEYVPVEETSKLKNYDFILGFGMGLKVTEEQRASIQSVADKGTPIYMFAVTNPQNNICNLDSVHLEQIAGYLGNGNKENYQNMGRYIRRNIDQKVFFAEEPQPVVESVSDAIFHLDEKVAFENVANYESYLKENGWYRDGANKVAIIAGIHDPFSGNKDHLDSLIVSLQRSGLNVYPVSSMTQRMDFLEQINPDAVVYFPHGRMLMGNPDMMVEWLKQRNIPLFAPITILQLKEDWVKDPMGMFGGFMGQTIVMPELDGSIYPYSLVAQEKNADGLYLFKTIPDRLASFTAIVNNVISLKHKENSQKKVAIYYFKGAGQETLAAQGLETVPSLYNLLKRLRAEGYNVDGLPASEKEFERLLMTQGSVLSTYAEGVFDEFLKNGKPQLVSKGEYESWVKQSLSDELYKQVTDVYGEAPGAYMTTSDNGEEYLAVARIQLGNVVLLPQPMAALGDDDFAIVHGAKMPPPHTYIGSYLWTQYGFKADALIHFGTHGSLEFTPQKQVALSSNDWADRLVGTVPHFYYYTIGNIGESMMAKRRSYATLISYLTPAFTESKTRSQFKLLQDKIRDYYKTDADDQPAKSLEVKKIAVSMGLHRDLRLDSLLSKPYSMEEIERIDNFAEEIANEKINGQLYVSGEPYSPEKINSTVMAMSADPIAYSLAALDKLRGRLTDEQLKRNGFFTERYLDPAKKLVEQVLSGKSVNEDLVCSVAGISVDELHESKAILTPPKRGMAAMMAAAAEKDADKGAGKPEEAMPKKGGKHPAWIPKVGNTKGGHPAGVPKHGGDSSGSGHQMRPSANGAGGHPGASKVPEYTREQKEKARAIAEIERTILNINRYKSALQISPEREFEALLNALSAGYVEPSSGGDAVANPNAVPTGRNLYSVNAEATPSEVAWDRGVKLVNTTLDDYLKKHGEYPRKVSYTFWSSEFIESEGTTIAQVLYMLGVEPIRDTYGRVSELRLIPEDELGRPRIDVVVQTSGQFRDLAASRLMLITKAVEMAASAKDSKFENLVAKSTVDIEHQLVEQGVSPKDARAMSTRRVFGGVNGMYGTNIQEMITSSDKWESEKEIADTYINNMGADYGSDKNWGEFQAGLLRTVLANTDVIVQPRQNNTWGALSLDHVYEFMGGMNLAIRNVTGKDPDAYFADYRNRNNAKMQDLKEAIGVEARATVLNPEYVKEVMKGGASSAAQITEVVTNTFGWNVTKPDVIDNELWDEYYNVYVKDKYNLGTESFFKEKSPAVLQEVTAIMMESARKGMWKATPEQLSDIAKLHTDLVKEFGSTGAGFAGGNEKLQDFIAGKVDQADAQAYTRQIKAMKSGGTDVSMASQQGKVLKKEQVGQIEDGEKNSLNGAIVAAVVLVLFVIFLLILRKKRKTN